jgi:23S rRNA (cytidine1920-2'-O)/16S rRNA (cytidine1409-2'-O)-methyltransferase
MRLDVYLTERGLVSSRTEAKGFITSSSVKVDGRVVTKPSFDIVDGVNVEIDKSSKKYVGRGGLKLESAISAFGISVSGKMAIDIGASSGGFTDCLLQNGASSVIAVDSGTNQLVDSLKQDSRVISIENYNARYMKLSDLPYIPDLCVMDVSFISATYIMPSIRNVLSPGADFVCLRKPQFEVGRSGLGKGGIVKSDKLRREAVDKVVDFAEHIGFSLISVIESPIIGGDGNIEFLAHFRNGEKI